MGPAQITQHLSQLQRLCFTTSLQQPSCPLEVGAGGMDVELSKGGSTGGEVEEGLAGILRWTRGDRSLKLAPGALPGFTEITCGEQLLNRGGRQGGQVSEGEAVLVG